MTRGKMCDVLRVVRKARQQEKYNLRRRRNTHLFRRGHKFKKDKSKPGRVCVICGNKY